MFKINLNGRVHECEQTIIGKSLLKFLNPSIRPSCIALSIDGDICDLNQHIVKQCTINYIFVDTLNTIDIVSYDIVHIMVQAVKKLFPDSKSNVVSTTRKIFSCDFCNIKLLMQEDLSLIEHMMNKIILQNVKISKRIALHSEAIRIFQQKKELLKVIKINALKKEKNILCLQCNFVDLCNFMCSKFFGVSTKYILSFKLTRISKEFHDYDIGLLQRIHGTFSINIVTTKKKSLPLQQHIIHDHRVIGKQMDLFHFQKYAQGAVFWHPLGWTLFLNMIRYIRQQQCNNEYLEINTPEIMDQKLWEHSGHWDKFHNNMFIVRTLEKNQVHAVRPMNCPGGIQIFKQGVKSYRDLPLRLAEFGKVYRYEASGALYGLMRLRAFTQDDAHIYCTSQQIANECIKVCKFVKQVYKDFGFDNVEIKFSNRPKQRIGSDQVWDESEKSLVTALKMQNLLYSINEGEGAFYGPKLEFLLHDSVGRQWQLGTLQVDFNLPERFNLFYIDRNGLKVRPVILHRALFGSIERFIGILLEHYMGRLPIWIAPIQIGIITIVSLANKYAQALYIVLRNNNIRCTLDVSNKKINFKLKACVLTKVPIVAIIGNNEVINNTVTLRKGNAKSQETLVFQNFVDKMLHEVKKRG